MIVRVIMLIVIMLLPLIIMFHCYCCYLPLIIFLFVVIVVIHILTSIIIISGSSGSSSIHNTIGIIWACVPCACQTAGLKICMTVWLKGVGVECCPGFFSGCRGVGPGA